MQSRHRLPLLALPGVAVLIILALLAGPRAPEVPRLGGLPAGDEAANAGERVVRRAVAVVEAIPEEPDWRPLPADAGEADLAPAQVPATLELRSDLPARVEIYVGGRLVRTELMESPGECRIIKPAEAWRDRCQFGWRVVGASGRVGVHGGWNPYSFQTLDRTLADIPLKWARPVHLRVTSAGRPVAGAQVALCLQPTPQNRDPNGPPWQGDPFRLPPLTTDEHGRARSPSLPPIRCLVSASSPYGEAASRRIDHDPHVPAEELLELETVRPFEVEVRDDQCGTPLSGATIVFEPPTPTIGTGQTDERGRFITRAIPPGHCRRLTVEKRGYLFWSVHLHGEVEQPLRAALERSPEYVWNLAPPSCNHLGEGAEVEIHGLPGLDFPVGAKRGVIRGGQLHAGGWSARYFVAIAEDLGGCLARIQNMPTGTNRLVFQRPTSLELEMVDPAGRPVRGIPVHLNHMESPPRPLAPVTRSDAAGRVILDRLLGPEVSMSLGTRALRIPSGVHLGIFSLDPPLTRRRIEFPAPRTLEIHCRRSGRPEIPPCPELLSVEAVVELLAIDRVGGTLRARIQPYPNTKPARVMLIDNAGDQLASFPLAEVPDRFALDLAECERAP